MLHRNEIAELLINAEMKSQEKGQYSPIIELMQEMCENRGCSRGTTQIWRHNPLKYSFLVNGVWKRETWSCHGGEIENCCFSGLLDALELHSDRFVKNRIRVASKHSNLYPYRQMVVIPRTKIALDLYKLTKTFNGISAVNYHKRDITFVVKRFVVNQFDIEKAVVDNRP